MASAIQSSQKRSRVESCSRAPELSRAPRFLVLRVCSFPVRSVELIEKRFDVVRDLVADAPSRLGIGLIRVLHVPVQVAPPRNDRAGVAATNPRHEIGPLEIGALELARYVPCLLYTSPSPRD